MLELVRRHIVIIAGIALGYAGYTFYGADAGKPEAAAKADMGGIDAAFLAVRDPAVPLQIGADPYRLEGASEDEGRHPAGPASKGEHPAATGGSASGNAGTTSGGTSGAAHATSVAPKLTQNDLMLAIAGALRQVASETHDLLLGPSHGASAAAGAAGETDSGAPRAGFSLLLQSTLDMRGGGSARINGRTVAEGETMPFLDPADPPLLRRVKGTAVIVRYGDRDYVADLLENPLLQVGGPVVAAVAPPPASPIAPGPAAPAAAAPSAAPQAATPAPTGTGAAKGKSGKKGSYRVRGSTKKP